MPARYPAIEPFEHGLLDASGRSAHGDAVMAATDRFTGAAGR